MLCLPLHTPHMLQSLDIAVFALLKHYFRGAVERRLLARGLQFPKAEFLETYSRIRPQAITQKNIKSGFRKAGLVPFNSRKALERLPAPLLESTLPLLQAQQISTLQKSARCSRASRESRVCTPGCYEENWKSSSSFPCSSSFSGERE